MNIFQGPNKILTTMEAVTRVVNQRPEQSFVEWPDAKIQHTLNCVDDQARSEVANCETQVDEDGTLKFFKHSRHPFFYDALKD